MTSKNNIDAASGKQFDLFCDVISQQNPQQNPQPNNTKGEDTKEVIADDKRQTSFLFTEKTKTTEITAEPSVTANNTDNSHTDAVGENTEPTPIYDGFTENNNQNLVENADISNIIQNLEISVGDVATNAKEIKVKIGLFNSLLFGNHAQINADKYIKEIANFYKNKNVISFFDALKNFPDTFPNREYFKTSFYTALIKFKDLEPRPEARVLATPLFAKKFNSIVKNNISLLIDRIVTLNLCGNIKKPSECDIKNFGQFGDVPRHDVFLTSDDLFIDGVVNNTDNTPDDIIEITTENDDFIQQILDITQAKTGTYNDNLPPTEKLNIINIADDNAPSDNDATNSTSEATTQVGNKFIPSATENHTQNQNLTDFITEATGHAFVLPKNENKNILGAYDQDFENLLTNKNLIKSTVYVKAKTKIPCNSGWQKHNTTEKEIKEYQKRHSNFGIRGGYLNYADLDIKTDKDVDINIKNNKRNFVGEILKTIKNFFVENKIISSENILFVRGRLSSTSCAVPFICDFESTINKFKHSDINTNLGTIELRIQNNSQTLCCGSHDSGERYVWNTENGYFPTQFPTLTIQQYENLFALLTEKFSANTPDLLNKKHKKQIKNNNNNNNKKVISNNISNNVSNDVSNDVIVNNNSASDYVKESNLIFDYLQKNNLITGSSNDGGYILECPFSHLHSTNNEKDFCFYPANTNNYKTFNFKCFHSHCSDKSKYDFVKALSADLYNTIKKYEVKNFEDANGNVFLCSNDGLLVIENTGKVDENGNLITNKIKLLNKPFYIVGEFFNKHNQSSHGYIVEFENINGISQRLPIKSIDLHTDAVKTFAFLFDNGFKQLNTKIDKKKLCEQYLKGYLNCFDFKNSLYNYTNKSGWQGNSCDVYIRPTIDDTKYIYFGENENDKYFYENKNKISFYSTKGTFDEWKENVGKYAKNNPLLITSIFHCLTSFFLPELKKQNAISDSIYFNLVGVSSKGKTTILNVCRSMIGSDDLNVTWAGTRAAFENLLQKYNHCFAPIDELSKADEKTLKTILEIIYSSKGKMLSNRDSNANREQKEWLITAISTSETTITELAQRYKINTMDGQNVRFIDVEFANANYKYGVFKDVDIKTGDDVWDGKIFAEKLEINSNLYYGTPMIELLNYLTTATAENPAVKKITKINATYNHISKDPKLTLYKKNYPATLARIAKYFNMVMAVGVFLSNESFNLLNITHYEVIDAIKEIFNIIADNYKNDDGTFTTKTGRTILQDLRDFILQNETHFRRRLKDKDKPNDAIENLQVNYDIENLFGYYDVVKDNKGTTKIYYVIPSIFKNYVLKDTPLNTAFNELVKLNIAVTGKDKYFRKNTKYYDNKTNKETQTNLYVFKNLFQ